MKVTTLNSSTREVIHCQTDHLTSFAILMSSTPLDAIHETILDVITYLGCSLSIIGLILSLVGLSVFRFVLLSSYSILKQFFLLFKSDSFGFGNNLSAPFEKFGSARIFPNFSDVNRDSWKLPKLLFLGSPGLLIEKIALF